MCLGIPGRVVEITDAERKLGMVDMAGVRRLTNLACVAGDDVRALLGSWVLVHVGFAMSKVDVAEAERTLALLRQMGDVHAELGAREAGSAEASA